MNKLQKFVSKIMNHPTDQFISVGGEVFWIVSFDSFSKMENKDLMLFNEFGHNDALYIFTMKNNNVVFLKSKLEQAKLRDIAKNCGLSCEFLNYQDSENM